MVWFGFRGGSEVEVERLKSEVPNGNQKRPRLTTRSSSSSSSSLSLLSSSPPTHLARSPPIVSTCVVQCVRIMLEGGF